MIQWGSLPIIGTGAGYYNLPVLPYAQQIQKFQYIPFGSMTASAPSIPVPAPIPQGTNTTYTHSFGSWFNFSWPSFSSFTFPSIKFPTLSFTGAWSGIKNTVSKAYQSASSRIGNFTSRIVSNAKKYLGFRESDGSYKKFTNGSSKAWCAYYATYVARESGSNIPHFSSVSGILDWGNRNNRFSTTAKVGDLIIFKGTDKNGKKVSHTGVVTKVENGRVYTTEGNTTDRVADRSYALNDSRITGYVSVA